MSRTAELLGMMTAHGVSMGFIPGGGQPGATLNALDVAGAMGMGHLERREALLLWVKYCADTSVSSELWAAWFIALMDRSRRSGWRTKAGQIDQLARITLEENLRDKRCKTCKGIGYVMDGQLAVPCEVCDETGLRFTSEQTIADRLGVTRHALRTHWADRLAWARHELLIWEHNGLSAISHALDSKG